MTLLKKNQVKQASFSTPQKGLGFLLQCLYVFVCIIFSNLYNPVFAETLITNTATANFSINGTSKTLSDSVQLTKNTIITPSDEITLQKQASVLNIHIEDTITYTLNVGNPNSSTLNNVVIQDTLPPGISFQTGTVTLNSSPINSNQVQLSGNQLSITLGTIPAESNWIISYKAKATLLGTHTNQAFALSDTANSEKATAVVTVLPPEIIPLALTKQADKELVKKDDIIHYSLSITNKNGSIISNANLIDSLPSGVDFIKGSAQLNQQKITANTSNGLSFSLGNIPANAIWTLKYDVLVTSNTIKRLKNSAKITATDAKANSNIANSTVEMFDGNITINKSANQQDVQKGDTITYTILVNGTDTRALSNIVINDYLPKGFHYQTGTAKLNGDILQDSAVIVLNNTHIQFSLGSLEKSKNYSLTYNALVTETAQLGAAKNTANVSSDFATSNSASATVDVIEPKLPIILIKTANKENIKPGEKVTYNLSIENPNSLPVNHAVVKDILPANLVYITKSAKLNFMPISASTTGVDGLSFEIGTIPANTTWQLSYQTQLADNASAGDLVNQAKITTDNTNANSTIATNTIQIQNFQIGIMKVADKENVFIGDTVTYTIIVDNAESRTLTDLVIEDSLPVGFSYIHDSAVIDSLRLPASSIQINGSQIKFSIGALAKAGTLSLVYKVKVTADTKPGQAVNTANVKAENAQSNTVSASVKVRTPSTIDFLKIDNSGNGIEAVIPPTSYNDNKNGGKHWQEVSSVTLPDGTVITLPSPQHIVDTEQYTISEPIVIQVTDLDQNNDPDKIETIIVTVNVPGTNDTEILLLSETTPNSGIFRGILLTTTDATLAQNGMLSLNENSQISVTYRDEEDSTDVSATAALITPESSLLLIKEANKQKASIGELVRYTLTFKNTSNYNIQNITLSDILPVGFKLLTDSITLNGQKVSQLTYSGDKLTLALGKIKAGELWTIEYLTKITTSVEIGDAINKAQIISGKIKSNIAHATVLIKDDLMQSKNILTGRVYIGCNTVSDSGSSPDKKVQTIKNARIYLETGRNILTDKEGFWHMEGVNPGKHVLQLDTDSLPDGYETIFCYENTRYAKNSQSRFIDLTPGTLWNVDFHVQKTKSVTKNDIKIKKQVTPKPSALFGRQYLEKASSDFEILWPKNNYVPPVASTKIYIKSSPKHRVEVYLNGKKISALNYDGSNTNKARTATIRRWLGVDIDIKRKNNTLLAILKDKSGKEIARKTHNIHFSGSPASVEFLEDQSILIADGKTIPVITIRVKDEDGFPMRANTHGYVSIKNNQFSIKTQNNAKDELNLNESTSGSYKYQIEEGGIAHIELNPTTQSGEVKLELKFNDRQSKTIKVWLKPKLREWILVGIAEGTIAYKTINDNIKSSADIDTDKFYKRGRIAFFAKGRVKGKYLLTLAYDSHKQKQEAGYQLNGDINPDSWYTIYADNSRSQYDAPSSSKLYLKIEKDSFFALFGDYRTGMTITELAKFERTLNGIKSEYKGKNISYNAFISETSNNHHHKEIPGDGTSGLYHLSKAIIPNSETIRIETRDRFHSETILETRELVRYQDYDIDYEAGTLFFKFPVTGRNANFDPNIIVVNYDTESDSNKNIVTGGRVAVNTNNDKLEVGATGILLTNKNAKNDSLIALDATYKINSNTKIHAEIAQSKTKASNYKSVNAQILELEKQIANTEAKIYYRQQGDNFGIDSQASEIGTKKIGANLKYKFNDKTHVNVEVSKQNNLSNNNQRQLAEISVDKRFNRFKVNAGLRHSKETLQDKSTSNNTALLGGSYTTQNGKVTLRGNIEKNIANKNESEQSPDRVLVGVDVKLQQGLTLFAEHEISENNRIQTQNSRIGVSKDLWKGAKGKTTFSQERTDQGQRNYATLGLSQNIKLTDKIKADISLDHAKTIGNNNLRFNPNEPEAQGTQRDDYTAFSVGLGSNDKDWSWTTRAEVRAGDVTDKINFQAGLIRHLEDGKNLSAKVNYTDSKENNGDFSKKLKISLGSAWHPKEKDFIFFSRLDWVDEEDSIAGEATHTQKIIHNLHYNRQFNEKTQLSVHHGIKHVFDESNSSNTRSTIDTGTLELRRDINKYWDIGAHVGYLRDWTENNTKTVAGVSVGVTPAENAWLQLGYNFEGFDDADFDGNDYKHQGIYTSFSYKFAQDTLRRKQKNVKKGGDGYLKPVKKRKTKNETEKLTEKKIKKKVAQNLKKTPAPILTTTKKVKIKPIKKTNTVTEKKNKLKPQNKQITAKKGKSTVVPVVRKVTENNNIIFVEDLFELE